MKNTVSLGADVGGRDAHTATNKHVLALRRLLEQYCAGAYGDVTEFALVLRIDGEVQAWDRSGVANVAVQKRGTFATADIFVRRESWSGQSANVLRRFLADNVIDAVSKMVDEVQTRNVSVNSPRLLADVRKATAEFLSQPLS